MASHLTARASMASHLTARTSMAPHHHAVRLPARWCGDLLRLP
ncbi:hypothetical protein [Streptomyces mesophilus]